MAYSPNPNDDPDAIRYDVISTITPEIEAQAGDAARACQMWHEDKADAQKTATPRLRHGISKRHPFGPCLAWKTCERDVWSPRNRPTNLRVNNDTLFKPRHCHIRSACRRMSKGQIAFASGVTAVAGPFGRAIPWPLWTPTASHRARADVYSLKQH